jgi:hypothetical protein
MATEGRVIIRNDLPGTLILNLEPECAAVPLESGEEASIFDVFKDYPSTLRLSRGEDGAPIVSIWPGDGAVRVEKDGIDVLDPDPAASGNESKADITPASAPSR